MSLCVVICKYVGADDEKIGKHCANAMMLTINTKKRYKTLEKWLLVISNENMF